MRIIIIGATGTIGRAIVEALGQRHQLLTVGTTQGEFQVDLASADSIKGLFEKTRPFDAVVCAAGAARFKPLAGLSDEDFAFSLANKLMGQVNVVRFGVDYITERGSFTLTSGILATQPAPGSAAISLVNAGVEGFVRAAALEMPRGVRVNVVSPPWVSETLKTMGQDPSSGLPARQVAAAYVNAVEGRCNGQVLNPRDYKV